jgi:hypothetical protein
MKFRTLILIFLFSFIWACKAKKKIPGLAESIRSVEVNLCKKGYAQGDSTWTIQKRMKFYGVPAVSIAVIRDYKILWSKQYGITDKETKEPVTRHTLFQAGSISKPVAAYAALHEVLKGKINLNENVNT